VRSVWHVFCPSGHCRGVAHSFSIDHHDFSRMNAEPTVSTTDFTDQDMSDALVLLHGLSEEAVESIQELTRRPESAILPMRPCMLARSPGCSSRRPLTGFGVGALKQKVGIVEEVLRRRGSQRP